MFTEFKAYLEQPLNALSLILHLVSVSSTINAIEWLTVHQVFKDKGLNSWKIKKLRLGFVNDQAVKIKILDFFFSYPNVLIIVTAQLLFGVLILCLGRNFDVLKFTTVGISICYILLGYRGLNGNNGADSMTRLVFTASSLYFLFPSNYSLKLVLFFISAQLIIAYVTPGFLRLKHPKWRSGEYLQKVLRIESFSTETIWSITTKYPKVLVVLSRSLIFFEFSFFIAVLIPYPFSLIYVLLGFVFHLINGIVMGLNTFIWAFIGSYPALIWTSIELSKFMFR